MLTLLMLEKGGGMFLNVDMLTLGRGGIGEHRSGVKMIKMIIKSGFPPPLTIPDFIHRETRCFIKANKFCTAIIVSKKVGIFLHAVRSYYKICITTTFKT